MLIGVIKIEEEKTIVRTIPGIEADKILEKWNDNKKGNNGSFKNVYNFVYSTRGKEIVCCVGNGSVHEAEEFLDEFFGGDVIFLADEILSEFGTFKISRHELNAAAAMESAEEALLEKSKKIYNFKSEIEKKEEKKIEKKIEPILKTPKKIFKETLFGNETDSSVIVSAKQNVKIEIDRDGKIIEGDAEGALSIKVDDAHKRVSFRYESQCDVRRIPTLTGEEGILCCAKNWPIDRAVTLLRWRSQVSIPFEFIFWPSEVADDQFSILFEIVAKTKIQNFRAFFSTEKISNISVENGSAIIDNFLQWSAGDLKLDEAVTFEFTCNCEDPDFIFPINICFTTDEKLPVTVIEAKLDSDEIEFYSVNSSVFEVKII